MLGWLKRTLTITLDVDWFYRKLGVLMARSLDRSIETAWIAVVNGAELGARKIVRVRPRFEPLSLDVQPYDRFAIAAAYHGVSWNDDAGHGRPAFGHNGDRLTDAEVRGRLRDGEVDERGMVLQRAAETLKGKRHRLSASCNRRRVVKRSRVDRAVSRTLSGHRGRVADASVWR
jgi:hypothetical protein